MPSRNCLPGDTIYIRATVLEAGSDYFQVLVDDGKYLAITSWVPAGECARHQDIGRLKPIRRAGAYLER